MEFEKILCAVKIPTIALIALWIMQFAIEIATNVQAENFTDLSQLGGGAIAAIAIMLIFFLLNMAVFFWAGFKTAKEVPGGAVEGMAGAVIAALIYGIVTGILGVIISVATPSQSGVPVAVTVIATIFVVIAAIVFNVMAAAVLGLIGGFVGKAK